MPDLPEEYSPNFEDRTAAMGATPYAFGYGVPREQVTPRTPGLTVMVPRGSPATPRNFTMNQVLAAMGQGGVVGDLNPATPRPQPFPGIAEPYHLSPEAQAANIAYRNREDLPMYGPTAGLQLPVSPLAQGYQAPPSGLRLTPVQGDPFAIPGT